MQLGPMTAKGSEVRTSVRVRILPRPWMFSAPPAWGPGRGPELPQFRELLRRHRHVILKVAAGSGQLAIESWKLFFFFFCVPEIFLGLRVRLPTPGDARTTIRKHRSDKGRRNGVMPDRFWVYQRAGATFGANALTLLARVDNGVTSLLICLRRIGY